MKKWFLASGLLVLAMIAGLFFYRRFMRDTQGPEIQFTEEIYYEDGMPEEEMLRGVLATDEKDGDVTDTLMIERSSLNTDGETATILYVARDSKNNMTKVSRTVLLASVADAEASDQEKAASEPSGDPAKEAETKKAEPVSKRKDTEPETDAETVKFSSEEAQTETEEMLTEDDAGDREDETESDETESGEQSASEEEASSETVEAMSAAVTETEFPYESESVELAPGSPVLLLTELYAVIDAGDEFDPLLYIASIEDDYDNKYELWRDIQMEGEYDVNTPGTYELVFYVTDSSGNTSNRAKFWLIVEE